jgi:hypothetical protein
VEPQQTNGPLIISIVAQEWVVTWAPCMLTSASTAACNAAIKIGIALGGHP